MDNVRIGLIGCGVIGRLHLSYFDKLEGAKLTAVSEVVADNLQKVCKETGAAGYDDAETMMDSGDIDAVLIATPHTFHPTLAIAAFDRGLHVLNEKPVAITAKLATSINEAHAKHPDLVYAAMFQYRANPVYKLLKHLIDDGRIGKLLRVQWTITTWTRTQAYFNQSAWRATWEGEGGGLLLNQCPHNLDMLYWLTGLPKQVIAEVGIAKHHDIEVEDEVNALLRYECGATGVFVTNTAEAPGVNRLEIVGDLGTFIAEPDTSEPVIFHEMANSVQNYLSTTPSVGFVMDSYRHAITPSPAPFERQIITQNFIDAIRHGEPLIAPGEDGLYSLELSNAMMMSGLNGSCPINLPTDHDKYDQILVRLIESGMPPMTSQE